MSDGQIDGIFYGGAKGPGMVCPLEETIHGHVMSERSIKRAVEKIMNMSNSTKGAMDAVIELRSGAALLMAHVSLITSQLDAAKGLWGRLDSEFAGLLSSFKNDNHDAAVAAIDAITSIVNEGRVKLLDEPLAKPKVKRRRKS